MKAVMTYGQVTARPISVKVHEWIAELADRFGDDETSAAIVAEAAVDKPMASLLGRVRDRLAQGAARRGAAHPEFVERDDFLAIVRGQVDPPGGPWIYETRDLTADEYGEVIRWSGRRMGYQ